MSLSPSTLTPRQVLRRWAMGSILVIAAIIGLLLAAGKSPSPSLLIALTMALISIGAAALFVVGLRDFTHDMRRAYGLISVGIILYGLGQLQFPLYELIDGSFIINSGLIVLPYLVSFALIFFGIRRLARLMQLRSGWASGFLAYGSAFAVVIVAILLKVNVVALLEIWLAVIVIFAAMTADLIRRSIAQRYRQALGWTEASFWALTFALTHHVVLVIMQQDNSWYANSGLVLWPSFLAAALFMKAGYTFTRVNDRAEKSTVHASAVDVIVYVASLASQPREINEPLNGMREITSSLSSAEDKLTPKQEAALVTVYELLEHYLVKQERLRTFTEAELKQAVRSRFQFNGQSDSPFWKVFAGTK